MAIRGYSLTIGAEPTALATVVDPTFKQLDIQASPDNGDNVYLCDSEGNSWGVLLPGKSWGTKEASIGGDVYISGTEGEAAYLIWVS